MRALAHAVGTVALAFATLVAVAPEPARATEMVDGIEVLTAEELAQLAKQRDESALFLRPSARINRYLAKSGEALLNGDLAEAQRLLERLNLDRLNPLERAMVFSLLGVAYFQQGNTESAISTFERAIAEQALPLKKEVGLRFNLVQLHAAAEQWDQVLTSLDAWRKYVSEATGVSWYLRAVANFQLGNLPEATRAAERAVASKPNPDESWLQLLAAMYVTQEDYAKVTPVLERLVLEYPKKSYWVQLSLIYGARENYRASLAVQQLAMLQGYLTEDRELQRLARSYVYAGLPYEAAKVLEQALAEGKIEPNDKAYEFLANSWIQAREFERSIDPLRKAAELSPVGDLFVRLGQVQMAREDWKEAAALFAKAIEKGDLKNPGTADLLLGIALYNDKQVGPARFSFARAREYENTRKAADDWLKHIEKETQSG
jgi:tetratricopeptide (TPR) repeat protein